MSEPITAHVFCIVSNLLMDYVCCDVTVKDDRLRCVKELVYAEEVYNECLKSLFELYGEPLRCGLLACSRAVFIN